MTKEDRLIILTNRAINELVIDKNNLQKAYNYYNGILDADQFKYLEENFGIGSPTTVEFIPLIKKHVDCIIGEYLGTPILPKITCKDSDTISNIHRERQLKVAQDLKEYLQAHLKNNLLKAIVGKDINDKTIEDDLNKLVEESNEGFISQYETTAQNVIEYIKQSRSTDLHTKLRTMLLDLLVTGYCFYKVKPSTAGQNIVIEVLNPLNTFIDKNPDSIYIKDSYRNVVRYWMTKSQILHKYGRQLKKEDLKIIEDEWKDVDDHSFSYITSTRLPNINFIEGNKIVGKPKSETYRYNLIPVYEVEWLETDEDFVVNRYSTVRIGQDIFILNGLDENVIRSKDNPEYCSLTVNGVYFDNRNDEPYSLVLACASLQDKYNALHFYRDNLISSSGTVGDWVDLSLIPNSLGSDLAERLQKWQAYKKGGLGILDSSMEGRNMVGQAPINTIFNGYDDTVKAQAIQAIQLAIDAVEQTCSSITGVFRERLNGIEARDAVTNIKVGQNNSFTITKPIYYQMDLITNELLLDSLNLAKKVFKNGITGTIILGDKQQRTFTALPEYFTLTDYDIHIATSTDVIKDLEQIKQVVPQFIQGGLVEPDLIIEVMSCKSLTEAKSKVKAAMSKKKAENNMIAQLQQQNQQLQQQMEQATQQLQQAQAKVEQLNEEAIKLEQQKLQENIKVKMFEAQTDREYKQQKIIEDRKRTELEQRQLYDGNPYNDQIKNI